MSAYQWTWSGKFYAPFWLVNADLMDREKTWNSGTRHVLCKTGPGTVSCKADLIPLGVWRDLNVAGKVDPAFFIWFRIKSSTSPDIPLINFRHGYWKDGKPQDVISLWQTLAGLVFLFYQPSQLTITLKRLARKYRDIHAQLSLLLPLSTVSRSPIRPSIIHVKWHFERCRQPEDSSIMCLLWCLQRERLQYRLWGT